MDFSFNQVFCLNGKPFFPLIYTGPQEPTSHFNVVVLALNMSQNSNLDWKIQKSKAQEYVEKGFLILWDLEMGLFQDLTYPLSDEMQLLSFQRALEHFKKEIFEEFKDHTFGVILYKGSLDFQIKWTSEEDELFEKWLEGKESLDQRKRLFKRDYCVDYLNLLLADLPDSLFPFLLFKVPSAIDEVEFLRLTSKEHFSHFQLGIKGTNSFPYARPFLTWESSFQSYLGGFYETITPPALLPRKHLNTALLLPPSSPHYDEAWEDVRTELKKTVLFRAIEIPFLTEEWDLLDTLIIFPKALDVQARRKVAGFAAAGGSVIDSPSA
jgi:hypothetical protein